MNKNRQIQIENALFLMTLTGLIDNIPSNDTPEMQKFSDCLDACLSVGYKGCWIEEIPKGNGDSIFVFEHDKNTAFGSAMLKIYTDAKNGIMPPDSSEIIRILEDKNSTIKDLLSHGIALVPIPFGQKGPTSKGWNEKCNVVTDVADEALLNGLNIGIAHAYCTPRPTCAIDLDNYTESKKWLAKQSVDLYALLLAKDAVVIHSGKVNSLKLLYGLPVGMSSMPSKSIKNIDNTMMIEFRCASANGLTVQDVLPPSMHPSGTQYKFMGTGSILALPTIPAALIKVWNELITANKSVKNPTTIRSVTPETTREVARVKEMLSHVSADCAYDMYRDVVWAVLSTGWTCAERLAEEWCKTAPERFEEINFIDVANSYNNSSIENPITLGTLHHLARAGGWNG